MFRKNWLRLFLGTGFAMMLQACDLIEDRGATETSVGSISTPPDFTVTPDAPSTPGGGAGNDNTAQQVPPAEEVIEEGFFINGGARRVNSGALELELITLNRFQMKISTDRDCQTGTWEPYQGHVSIPTPARNQLNYVSVQYKDWDNMVTRCYRQSVVHDDLGPEILFTRYPMTNLEEGSVDQLIFEVADAAGDVQGAQCRMAVQTAPLIGTLEKDCFKGRNTIDLAAMAEGSYEFEVSATDDLGNSSSKKISWQVVSTTRALSHNIHVDNYRKVDILMVIDNSGSMAYEQQSMASRMRNFLSVIRGLDWQIAVTTTDPESGRSWGDGRLLPIVGSNGQYILNSSTPEETAQDRLGRTLQRSETGSGSEQGIRAAYRTIERYVANESNPRAFFRQGAQFAVVLISDEDESANAMRNDPNQLLRMVSESFQGQKRFSFHSIITRPGDTQCRNTHGYAYGDRYKIMSELTGGIIGSVCESDYAGQIAGIAQGVRDLLKTLTLQCAPLAAFPVTVKKDGVVVTAPFRIDGVNLKFDEELEPGAYQVDYRCVK